METPEMEELIQGFHELLAELKRVKRSGWVRRGVREAESVAGHSFAVVALAVVLADIKGLDPAEAARIAILHDLPEAVIGDLTPEQKEGKLGELKELEERVIVSLAKGMPAEVAERYLSSWRRYVKGESEEARLVKLIDKLEMGLQASSYAKEGGAEKVEEIYRSALEALKGDPELAEVLRKVWERRDYIRPGANPKP